MVRIYTIYTLNYIQSTFRHFLCFLCFLQWFFWKFLDELKWKMKRCWLIHLFLIFYYLTVNNSSYSFFVLEMLFCCCFLCFFFFFLQIEELLNGARIQKSNLLEVQRKCPWSKAAHIHPPAASKRIHSKSTTNEYMDWNILPLSFFVKCHSNEKSVGHCK